MLTDLMEGGKKKADQYWPDENERMFDLDAGVKLEFISSSYTWTYYERKIRINIPGLSPREVTQIQTKRWADLTAPDETNILRDMVSRARELSMTDAAPILVHCSAGVGRTGTFVALYKLITDYENKK